jgi:hypothetical protein
MNGSSAGFPGFGSVGLLLDFDREGRLFFFAIGLSESRFPSAPESVFIALAFIFKFETTKTYHPLVS